MDKIAANFVISHGRDALRIVNVFYQMLSRAERNNSAYSDFVWYRWCSVDMSDVLAQFGHEVL